jgi:hypothetical protein
VEAAAAALEPSLLPPFSKAHTVIPTKGGIYEVAIGMNFNSLWYYFSHKLTSMREQ